jgi:hypothetical protein
MGKQTIITINGKDYDVEGFRKYLNGLHPEARKLAIKDIITRMMEDDPEETRQVFRDAMQTRVN